MSPFDTQQPPQQQCASGAAVISSPDFKIPASNGILIDADQQPAYEFLVEALALWNEAPKACLSAPRPRPAVKRRGSSDAQASKATRDEAHAAAAGSVSAARDTPQEPLSEIKPTSPPPPAAGKPPVLRSTTAQAAASARGGGGGGDSDAESASPEPVRVRARRPVSAGSSGRKHAAKKKHATTSTAAQRTCSHCSTAMTSVWRRSADGKRLCNACGVFAKAHGVLRPLELRKDVVYTRKRKSAPKRKGNSDDDDDDDGDDDDVGDNDGNADGSDCASDSMDF
ncbi:Transcription factor GATA-5 [Entophlyctis sp. JEL0112]|nr:Transcription factor GATA-5 [Entophlyctis sp. JEL0112]